MSFKNPPWVRSGSQFQFNFIISSDSMLIVLYSGMDQTSVSRGCYFNSESLLYFLNHENEFMSWIKNELASKEKLTFRILGPNPALHTIEKRLINLGLTPGKSIEVLDLSHFQYIPSENRIRRQKNEEKHLNYKKKIKVLVIDDSETIRKLLHRIISDDPDLECVGTVELPSKALKAIEDLRPDVLTLDIHMPEMDGIALLKKILPIYPLPVVMISSLSREEGVFVLDALEAGAVDYIQKPSFNQLKTLAPLICERLKNAKLAKLKVKNFQNKKPLKTTNLDLTDLDLGYLIGIGSSTGGTEALKEVLTSLPDQIPPILIVQHIPPIFSKSFADRMNHLCRFEVREANDGDLVLPNQVLVAPGGFQMRVIEQYGNLKVLVEDTDPVNRHKPSVDVLFDSMALLPMKKMVAAILTGMGADGAKGLLKLRQRGIFTVGQDEASCVVYGMPKEAAKIGAVTKVLPLDLIGRELLLACGKAARKVG